jgi:hypothetical protein
MRRWLAGLLATSSIGGGTLFAADRAQNPYEDRGNKYVLEVKADIPQGERVEIHKDKAQMDLRFWNDEETISIIPQIPTAPTFGADEKIDRPFVKEAERPLLSKQIQYREGDVTAFIEPREGTENEFDIDFTLHAKPETNVFEYKIDGAEQFDFFYQPPLTDEEIAEGAERPENVVGSYAVYHKTKANHRVGDTNYATGKAFHIYRPKAIDANGAEVWAELSYENGLLLVTVPADFLEKAAYPVVVDPTFGHTVLGASCGHSIEGALNRTYTKVSLTEDGAITMITAGFLINSGTTWTTQLAIYNYISDTDIDTMVRHTEANNNTYVTSTSELVDHTLIATQLTAGTYYLAAVGENKGGALFHCFDSTQTAGNRLSETSVFGYWQSPVSSESISTNNSRYSIYATYTTCTNCSPYSMYYTVPGYTTWTVPDGVDEAIIACWGGGGGGGDGNTTGQGGGGGGAFASSTVAVSPSDVIRLFIGEGGAGGSSSGAGANGGTTTASTTAPSLLVSAAPGWGSVGAAGCGASCPGGRGGATASSTGTTLYAGGNGGTGETGTGDEGGGGGGAGGPHGAGANGGTGTGATVGGTGGTADNGSGGAGGAGGNGIAGVAGTSNTNGGGGGGGGDDGTAGAPGGAPGGGGGGAEINTTTTGAGAGGQCTITYTIAAEEGDPAPEDDTYFEIISLHHPFTIPNPIKLKRHARIH